ncbi:hypothetical protein [Streptomyces sp. NPDC090022]|uniref:hypothetical protein n=1 Tax=Streptomyces sp. NPDC090022 TaxID=3365920 RepID=UPI0037F5E5B6
MFRRTSALATAALAAAAALVLAASTTATAASAPGFIQPRDLPPHPSSPWSAGPVTSGLPDHPVFCLDGALPANNGWHRRYGTEFDTSALQISWRTASGKAAAKLAASLERRIAACAADWLRANPGGTASWQDYGPVRVEEGAHVYGVHTSIPDSEPGVTLFGVGRDGATVTVVKWSQMGYLADAPVRDFSGTTATAVNRLDP